MRLSRLSYLASRPFAGANDIPRRVSTLPSIRTVRRNQTSSQSPPQKERDFESKEAAQRERGAIDRQSTEYSKSGTDDEVAAQRTSFQVKSSTNPEDAMTSAGQESNTTRNPLEVSPANPDVSTLPDEVENTIDQKVTASASTTRTFVGKPGKSQQTESTTTEKKVHKMPDRRKPGEARTIIRPGSR